MPLISQSKVFNFQLLCQLTRAQATEAWASASEPVPGEYPWTLSAWQGNHSTWNPARSSKASTWEEETGEKGQRRRKRRLREKQSGSGGKEGGKRDGPERACLVLSLCPQLFFWALFKWLRGPSQRCYFPINRAPHLFLSFQPRFKVPEGAVKLEPAQVYKCKILQ